jgi:hypothetical protein
MDQMIADFNRYLLTHEWRQLREKLGYDLVFIDEFHYFNRAERMLMRASCKIHRTRRIFPVFAGLERPALRPARA